MPSPAAGMTAFFTFTEGNDTGWRRRPSAGVSCALPAGTRPYTSRAMPTYEYVCKSCGHIFEIVQSSRTIR